ncbi:hypothetical protein DJ021_13485 [Phenylobacterium hankyongense]|uniref:DUF2029 domain-containing protein n=1 Tax=Phenylobacterium hankyongense TaxID=1813876 RepID=A0A328B1Q6_9CAUL|nr:hypothetical protein DJ021_13485 [Phenylobacterium hankyongense]
MDSYSKSTYIVSSVFSALGIVVLSRVLYIANVHFLALPFIVMGSGVSELAKTSSADSLAVFAGMLCILALLKRSRMVFLLAAILPAMRTDYILISMLVLAVEFVRERRAASIISAAVALLAYISINKFSGNYGWLTLFNHSVVAATPYPAELTPSSNWMDYIRPYVAAIYDMISSSNSIAYVVAIYFVCALLLRDWRIPPISRLARYVLMVCRKDIQSTALLVVPILFVAGHLLMFPDYEPRFFVLSAALALVWILSKGTIKGLAPWQRARSPTEASAAVGALDPSLGPA